MRRILMIGVVVGGLSAVSPLPAREAGPAAADRARVVAAAREIMDKARYCTMVTVARDGQPQARVVDAFGPEPDMTVWIGTNPLTRKIAEIRANPRVTLLYFDTTGHRFVTLLASATVVTDPMETRRHWKEEWANLYKDKNRGDDYVLLRVTPFRLEIVADGFPNDPKTWRPMSIDLR